jgi:uncharacterized membrane protein YphA (DoxX/SURF4 family)
VGAVALAARIVVAAAFVVAAVQKLRALSQTRAQLAGFGVPGPLVSASVVVLPVAELVTAAALVALPRSSVPPFVAVGLLAVFTGAVIGNLSRGRRPPCPCFGAGTSDVPISGHTVLRNGWLLALAVVATGSIDGAEPLPVVVMTVVFGTVTLWLLATLH